MARCGVRARWCARPGPPARTRSATPISSLASLVDSSGAVSSRMMSKMPAGRLDDPALGGGDLGRVGVGRRQHVVDHAHAGDVALHHLAGLVGPAEVAVQAGPAEVAVDDQHRVVGLGEHGGQVGDRGGLALGRTGRGDQDDLGRWCRRRRRRPAGVSVTGLRRSGAGTRWRSAGPVGLGRAGHRVGVREHLGVAALGPRERRDLGQHGQVEGDLGVVLGLEAGVEPLDHEGERRRPSMQPDEAADEATGDRSRRDLRLGGWCSS